MPALSTSHHLLIPFAGRSSPACREALTGLRLPKLESLLSRLALVHEDTQDESTLSPPHERALAAALGIEAADGQIPWAALEAKQAGLSPTSDGDSWGIATLCHWQVGIDDVVLGDPAAIRIDAAESDALLAAARPSSRKTASRCTPRPRRAAGLRKARCSTAWPPPRSTARSATPFRSGHRSPTVPGRCAGCRTRCRCCSTPSA